MAPGILIEIKTRAARSDGPLESLQKFACYFIQCQLQMICSDSEFCILMSYHPESKTANYFLIQRDNLLWSVIKTLTDSILSQKPIVQWDYREHKLLEKIETNTFLRIPDFKAIKPLRTYINQQLHTVKRVIFSSSQ